MTEEEKNEIEDAFFCYNWIVLYTNPITERLYTGNLTIPLYIEEQVNELKETGWNPDESNPFLSSASINLLLIRLVGKNIPLYKVGDREISSVAGIKCLWDEMGLNCPPKQTGVEWKEYFGTKAYLKPQYLKIEKQFEAIRLEPASTQQDKMSKTQCNIFRWAGGTWEITYEGETIRPTDSKGLRYIHYLMHHPGKQIPVLELVQIWVSSGKAKQSLIEKGRNAEIEGLNESDSEEDSINKLSIKKHKEDDVTDSLSVEEYERCLSYLREQEESAKLSGNVGELAEIQEKINKVEKELKASQNKYLRSRKFTGDIEQTRKAVYDCITRALTMTNKEHPSLGKHLKPLINTGASCGYNPTKEILWELA